MQVLLYVLLFVAVCCLTATAIAIVKIRKLQRSIQQTQLRIGMLETMARFLRDVKKQNDL